ncbi:MAG: hypothetical protein ACK4N5_21420, partial [Myxococcales bacterium]
MRIIRALPLFALAGATAVAWACGTPVTDPGTDPNAAPYEGPTYWKDVAPIVQNRCEGCHSTGGIAPFNFERYETVKAMAGPIKASVQNRTMPPWPPAPGCATFKHDKSLTDAEIATITAWADNAQNPKAEGDPAHKPAPLEQKSGDLGLGAPSFVVDMPAYTSTIKGNDDYRCFIVDPQ